MSTKTKLIKKYRWFVSDEFSNALNDNSEIKKYLIYGQNKKTNAYEILLKNYDDKVSAIKALELFIDSINVLCSNILYKSEFILQEIYVIEGK